MRIVLLLVAVLCAAAAATVVAHAGAAGDVTGFRTPDAGAACRLERATLVCSSLGSAGSVALGATRARVVRELPWWDASTPVLQRWNRAGTTCRLAGNAILCRNASVAVRVTGTGFAVAG